VRWRAQRANGGEYRGFDVFGADRLRGGVWVGDCCWREGFVAGCWGGGD